MIQVGFGITTHIDLWRSGSNMKLRKCHLGRCPVGLNPNPPRPIAIPTLEVAIVNSISILFRTIIIFCIQPLGLAKIEGPMSLLFGAWSSSEEGECYKLGVIIVSRNWNWSTRPIKYYSYYTNFCVIKNKKIKKLSPLKINGLIVYKIISNLLL